MHVNNFAKTIALIEECAKLCCAILSPGSTLDNGREIFLVSSSTNPSNRQFHILDESSAGKELVEGRKIAICNLFTKAHCENTSSTAAYTFQVSQK